MTLSTLHKHGRLRRVLVGAVLVAAVGGALGTLAVSTDALGAGKAFDSVVRRVDRLLAGPVPDRETRGTILVTDPPETPAPTPTPQPTPIPSLEPGATPTPTPEPTPTPTPAPERKPVDVDIVDDPKAMFASQVHNDWCASAGVQMVLAVLGLADTSDRTQREIAGRVREWESYDDSHNGEWGPAAITLALEAYGAPGYEIRAFKSRSSALRDAAIAIKTTGAPVVLLTWRGAHTWVMTGYRADADPTIFKNAKVTGTYILDPWYPRISSIWGASDRAGTFQNEAEMKRNFLQWKRPEGKYPDRDGLWITVVPTIKVVASR